MEQLREISAASRRPPLFVVGMPRSGTKLLRDLLNQHPLVGIPEAETELLPDWALRWPEFGDLRQPRAWARFVEMVRDSAYFVYLAEERGVHIDPVAWRLACADFTMAGVFEGLCRLHGGAPDDGIWGDKSPGYLRHLGLVWDLWPQARVLHIVRDVRDQVMSAHKAWGKDPIRSAARWADGLELAQLELQRQPGRWQEVRYEDLVTAPETVLREICAFVGLPWDPAVLSLSRPSENLGDAKGVTTVVSSNVEKWRTQMDPKVQRRVEALAADGLRRHDYPCQHQGPATHMPRVERRLRQLRDGASLVRFDVNHRGMLGAMRFRWRLFRETGGWE